MDRAVISGADISTCGLYRYRLWRKWDDGPTLTGIFLNPSKADASINDPTVTRFIERAKRMGFGGIQVLNIFAFRSTDPKQLKKTPDPIGPLNNKIIAQYCTEPGMVICGWGSHGTYLNRDVEVKGLIHRAGIKIHVLKLTKQGQPGHPLYIGYDIQPKEF